MGQQPRETPTLGELEIEVLEYLWQGGESSVRELHEALCARRKLSANTVQSAMERLFRKGLLSRHKSSHRYVYKAEVSRSDLLGHLINDLVTRFQPDASSSAAAILNAAERIDEQALDLLEAEIQRRREARA